MTPMAAPDFPSDLEWLNVDRPLSIRDLSGRVVLLSFATFTCSNCMRLAPDIRRLEERHPGLVVVEVHYPGFESSAVGENFREAVRRAGLEHPVAIDRERLLWRVFGVRDWPTFVLIDPQGNVVGKTAGEGLYGRLAPKIDRMAAEFGERGLIRGERLSSGAVLETSLYRPGKIAADNAGMRLFMSDTGHNRIVVADGNGKILETIGSGAPGNIDG